MSYDKQQKVFDCMMTKRRVYVKTATRVFNGFVYEVGISPFEGTTTARVVDDEGRVHYFRIERAEVT